MGSSCHAAPVPYVYLVDDDPAVLDANHFLLQSYGWRVRAFESAQECLRALPLHGELPDCILSDLDMPGMNGAELVHHLATRGPDVACVIVTGNPDSALARKAKANGALDVLEKPASLQRLAEVVLRAVDQRLVSPSRTFLAPPLAWRNSTPPPLGDADFRATYALEAATVRGLPRQSGRPCCRWRS